MSALDIVTVRIGGHLCGIDARSVQDVFHPRGLTPVPCASQDIVGLLNLRGRIVTAVCMRRTLGLPPRPDGAPEAKAVGVELGGDSYGLVVDGVENVIPVDSDDVIAAPAELPARWTEIIQGVVRLPDELLVLLNVERLFGAQVRPAA
jgi:purine-binding chemotaxis protein CheW